MVVQLMKEQVPLLGRGGESRGDSHGRGGCPRDGLYHPEGFVGLRPPRKIRREACFIRLAIKVTLLSLRLFRGVLHEARRAEFKRFTGKIFASDSVFS